MKIQTWPAAQEIRRQHLDPAAKLTDAVCISINAAVSAFLNNHDPGPKSRTWWTAQLATGKICGIWAETELEARIEIEIWRGSPTGWITRDPHCKVLERYGSSVLVKHRHEALFEVTAAPVETPRATNVPMIKPQQPTLFDLIGAFE